MPAATKKKLKDDAENAGIEMVRKVVDSEGRTRVCNA